MKKRVVNVIAEELINEGVDYLFGVTGKTIAPLLDATLDYDKLEFIAARHESGAALMAYGFAQGSGKIGVCCGSTGGGSTNLATGVATAYMNSVPLLVITGQVSTADFGKGAFQESTGFGQTIDTVDFFRAITKESFSLINPLKAPEIIRYAIRSAISGRMGPVHVNIPFDVQLAVVEYEFQTKKSTFPISDLYSEVPGMRQAVNLINKAQRPVLLAGWGAVFSGARKAVIQIARRFEIPVATTIQGKGAIPADHPYYLGVVGICGHPVASEYIFNKSDLLIAIGTSFGEFSTYGWDERFLKNKKIIQIDIDSREIGKNYPVELGLVGDAKSLTEQLFKALEKNNIDVKISGREVTALIKEKGRLIDPLKMKDNSVPLKPQRLLAEIGEKAPDNTFFLADSSSHWAWAIHYLPIGQKGNFFPTLSLGAMGASISSAIGIKLSNPDNPVVCICGDGSFLMGGNEVATTAQYNIPVIWIVFNDERYGMPDFSNKKIYSRTTGTKLNKTDFSLIARGYGLKGFRVDHPDQLREVLDQAFDCNCPVVIDVLIDPDEMPPVGQRKLIRVQS
ncbi:thiamine pyrophosphate-binding protein [Anaerophaga thermohalophila]|uniref:thiamine pyrophosphate-binding protein n=1 Tax=Anaerophaga thermohalophila TaxID=177400 RepID=UPI0002FC2CA6|nr:thiamine pyrophosphate-binding protein [Anaerophaga thermohalophila]